MAYTFQLTSTYAVDPTAYSAISIVNADVNADGKTDILVSGYGGVGGGIPPMFYGKVSVLLGHGDGTFTAAPDAATGAFLRQAISADLNRDGRADLLVNDEAYNCCGVAYATLTG
jgi:hypothetical protein